MFKGLQLQKKVHQNYSFCVLHIVSWCFTFLRNFISRMVFSLQSGQEYMVEMAMFNVQRKIIPKGKSVMVHVFCTSSHSTLHLCEDS